MPFASIFVPDFAVEAVLRAEPELRSQSVAVLEGKPPLQRIFGLNEKARHAGLELGMTRLQADICPDLAFRCRSPLQESAAHTALLDCAQSFSPRVEDTASDTVVLDISGTEPLFGAPAKLARDLARRASELGLEANVAVAANPDAAILAARGYPGVTVLPSGCEEERLGLLPLDVLVAGDLANRPGEPNPLLETLDRWGIRTLQSFAALPEIAISERLGQKGVYLQKLARGTVSRTLVPIDPRLSFEEAIELEYPVVLLEPLAFLLGRLLDQVCARLSARALATQELHLQLELETGIHLEEDQIDSDDGVRDAHVGTRALARPGRAKARLDFPHHNHSHFTRTLSLPVPMLDPKVFLKLLQLDLRSHPPGAPIKKITLSAEPARMRAAQGGLFQPPSPEPEKLELTMARISGIVGEGRLGAVEILDSHRPEAFRLRHFTPAILHEKKSKEKTDSSPGAAVTALRIFRPPLRTTVTLRDGKPAHIACQKKKKVQGEVIWQAGPWRSSGDWWEHEPWARDEWDIALQTETGIVLYRLVHDLLSGRWHLEGTYD
jgi:protein ImuB